MYVTHMCKLMGNNWQKLWNLGEMAENIYNDIEKSESEGKFRLR